MLKLKLTSAINGAPIFFLAKTTSTMEVAKQLVLDGAQHGSVVWADYQTHGRGRFTNRPWESQAGLNLLFTVILECAKLAWPYQILPFLCALAVSRVLKNKFNLHILIKWPNDLVYNSQKLAGILCLQAKEFILAGIGLNCNQTDFPASIESRAISLNKILGYEIDRLELLKAILDSMAFQLVNSHWQQELQELLWAKGQRCWYKPSEGTGQTKLYGIPQGITEKGELIFQEENNQLHRFSSGSYGLEN